MWLDNFAPEIQEEILFLPRATQGLWILRVRRGDTEAFMTIAFSY